MRRNRARSRCRARPLAAAMLVITVAITAGCVQPGPEETDAVEGPPPISWSAPLVGVPNNGYPNYEELLQLVAMNRARADPNNIPAGTAASGYTFRNPVPPLLYDYDAGQAARFHCDHLTLNDGGLSHDTYCTLRTDIEATGCDGSASCSCEVGSECWSCTTLGGCGTGPSGRLSRFGFTGSYSGEVGAAGYSNSWTAVAGWMSEVPSDPTEGHRFGVTGPGNHLVGTGYSSGGSCWNRFYFSDFGSMVRPIPLVASGVHRPESGSASTTFDFYANYYDASTNDPTSIDVVVNGTCYPMSVELGSNANYTYLYSGTLSSGCNEYYFLAYDASGSRGTYPEIGSNTIDVSGGPGCGSSYVSTQMPASCEMNNCGDGTCATAAGETCSNCGADCGACPPICGDGVCDASESCASCASDCGACPPMCGDGGCNGTEDCMSCAADCGACPPTCGDGSCNGTEDCVSCAADCGTCPPVCGDGSCNGTEDCTSCAADCGACPPTCGNTTCDPAEDCNNCPGDCGACPPVCGDATCDPVEDCASCPADCGVCPPVCGDGICEGMEDCATCPGDCGACGPCMDGEMQACGLGACAGMQTCAASVWGACDGPPPAPSEVCGNGLDDDCNGPVDDGCNGGTDAGIMDIDGGPPAAGAPTVVTGGCGCRVPGHGDAEGPGSSGAVLIILLLGCAWGVRRRRPFRFPVFGLIVVALLFAAAPAEAAAPASKPKVYILKFGGPAAPTVRADVVTGLKGKVAFLPKEKLFRAAARAKVPRPAISKPKLLPKVIKAAKLAYAVKGTVKKGKGGLTLSLKVLDSGGAAVWSANLKIKAGHLVKPARERIAAELVPLMTGAPASVAAAAPPDPSPPSPPVADEGAELPDLSGPMVDVEEDGKKKKGKKAKGDRTPREDDPSRPPVVVASAGGGMMFRSHKASSSAFVSNAADLCDGFLCFDVTPYYAISAELDVHPGSLTSSKIAAMFGITARYVHGFLPSSYELTDPATGAATPVDIPTGHRDLSVDAHAEIPFSDNKWFPRVEPALGFGWLNLGAGANPIDLRAMSYAYAWAGLRLSQPLFPPYVHLVAVGQLQLAFGVGSDAESAYGEAGGVAATGFGVGVAVHVIPIKWVDVSLGWRFQRLGSSFEGVGESGFDGVKVVDAIHGLHVTAGVRIP